MNDNLHTTIVVTTAQLVRGYLRTAGDWRTVTEIAGAIDRKPYQVRGELSNCLDRGYIIKEFSNGAGRRQRYRWAKGEVAA